MKPIPIVFSGMFFNRKYIIVSNLFVVSLFFASLHAALLKKGTNIHDIISFDSSNEMIQWIEEAVSSKEKVLFNTIPSMYEWMNAGHHFKINWVDINKDSSDPLGRPKEFIRLKYNIYNNSII